MNNEQEDSLAKNKITASDLVCDLAILEIEQYAFILCQFNRLSRHTFISGDTRYHCLGVRFLCKMY
jgi:hypothetical protein